MAPFGEVESQRHLSLVTRYLSLSSRLRLPSPQVRGRRHPSSVPQDALHLPAL